MATTFSDLFIVVDMDADPFGTGKDCGAIGLFNRATGSIQWLASDPQWQKPVDVVRLGQYWMIVDIAAGCVWQWDTQQIGVVTTTKVVTNNLQNPTRWLSHNGMSFLVESTKDVNGSGPGAFLEVTMQGSLAILGGPPLMRPSDAKADILGRIVVLDADANPNNLPALNGYPQQAAFVEVLGAGASRVIAAPSGMISPMAMSQVPMDGSTCAGTMLVIDANACAFEPAAGGIYGKLFFIDLRVDDQDAHEIQTDQKLSDPVDVLYVGNDRALVADLNFGAQPDQITPAVGYAPVKGTGAILDIDLADGTVTVACQSTDFRNPCRIVKLAQ